jgi:P27 family predicted phage terminase small subunit
MPAHVASDPLAKSEWKRILPELRASGLISRCDVAALSAYCLCYSRWIEAEAQCREHGNVQMTKTGYFQKSAYRTIADKALTDLRTFIVQLGLSPKARGSVSATATPDDDGEFFS